MDRKLRKAAVKGDVGFLSGLRKDDRRLLKFFDCTPVGAETPLHVALLHEQPKFATAILELSPELARMPNERGSYPLHLASARGYVDVVDALLKIDPSLSCLRDKEGRTALASAALNEKVEVLKLLYPEYKRQVEFRKALGNEREELILHICVERNLLEIAKVLVKLDGELVKKRDDNGNTPLHLAAAKRNPGMLKFLKEKMKPKDQRQNNSNAFEEWEIDLFYGNETIDQTEGEGIRGRMKKLLRSNPLLSNLLNVEYKKEKERTRTILRSNPFLSNLWDVSYKEDVVWTTESHNTMLLLATLMVTVSFQAGLNPPGGFWQEPPVNSQHSATFIVGTAIHNNIHKGGFRLFMYFNMISFFASLTIILSSVSWFPWRPKFSTWMVLICFWIALFSMAMAFLFGTQIIVIHDRVLETIVIVLYTWLALMAILIFSNFTVLMNNTWLSIIFLCLVGPLVILTSLYWWMWFIKKYWAERKKRSELENQLDEESGTR